MASTYESTDVFEKLRVDKKQKEILENIDKKRMQLEEQSTKHIADEYQQVTEKVLKGEATVEDLTKLEAGIERGKKCTSEIYEITAGLATDFEDLSQFVGNLSNYQGVEKTLERFGFHKSAYKRMVGRIKGSDIKQNLETIIDFGHLMVHKLNDSIIANNDAYFAIEAAIKETSKVLSENQPVYEYWRSQREIFDRQMTDLKEKQSQATGDDFAKLQTQVVELQSKVDKAKFNEDHYFAQVDKAKQALKIQPIHLQAYRDNVNALDQIKTRFEADIQHNTPLFMQVKTSIETGVTTKASGQYYKGLRMAVDKTTDTVQKMSAGVMAEAATIAEKQTLDEDKAINYKKVQDVERADFDRRNEVLKNKHEAPAKQPAN